MGDTVLEVKDFIISFIKSNVETDYQSFDIKKGDFMLLKGRNGCGKTTFLKVPTLSFSELYFKIKKGDIVYYKNDGEKIITTSSKITVSDREELRRNITEVRQDENFNTNTTPYRLLLNQTEIAIEYMNLNSNEKEKLLDEANSLASDFYTGYTFKNGVILSLKEILNISKDKEFYSKKVNKFSGGQQKMLQVISGFIKAKITKSNLMLIDEPTNNLDGKNKYYVNELIKELINTGDIAIIMISHCHVFDDVNKIIDVDRIDDKKYQAKVILKTKDNSVLFLPHHDCIEDCENMNFGE